MWSRAREVANGKVPAPFLIQEDDPQVDRNLDRYHENTHRGELPLTDGLSTKPNPREKHEVVRWIGFATPPPPETESEAV